MSVFTQFSAVEQLQYDLASSQKCGKELWKVVPGFRYYIGVEDSNKYVDVPTGFLTDGATVPRWLWWLVPPMGDYSQATTLHDCLCTRYWVTEIVNGVETQLPVTRAEIDAILREAMNVLTVKAWEKVVINGGVDIWRILTNPTIPKPVAVGV
jgi:hypothetical protein